MLDYYMGSVLALHPIYASSPWRGGGGCRKRRALERAGPRGIGIEPENLERIFGRFERAVSARKCGGLGLGLFIWREIVHAHGGWLRVGSAPERRACFVVELPLGAAHARP